MGGGVRRRRGVSAVGSRAGRRRGPRGAVWCAAGWPPRGPNRVIRGGSWNNNTAFNCRSANRNNNTPGNTNNNIGFRVVLAPALAPVRPNGCARREPEAGPGLRRRRRRPKRWSRGRGW
ncbi:MAG: SUMF1/EgtB/PvdO family nonheme iron enzyme [Phycisphaerales bacterium]|nr:SUMF1/EgtB/PvdO family nonheme iron enzyme [Phycisphaerales bacterium]